MLVWADWIPIIIRATQFLLNVMNHAMKIKLFFTGTMSSLYSQIQALCPELVMCGDKRLTSDRRTLPLSKLIGRWSSKTLGKPRGRVEWPSFSGLYDNGSASGTLAGVDFRAVWRDLVMQGTVRSPCRYRNPAQRKGRGHIPCCIEVMSRRECP